MTVFSGAMMIDVLLATAVVVCVVGLAWLGRIVLQTKKDVFRIMEVLAVASPVLERRILEQGTQVVIPNKWLDDEVWESEEVS